MMESAAENISQEPASRADYKIAWVLLALMACAMSLRPGDAPFVADEPRLVRQAVNWDKMPMVWYGIHLPFSIAQHGLEGSKKIIYGPAPLWIYQVLFAISHDLMTVVAMRALLVGGVTAWALAWLARTIRVSPWLAVVTMLSPWLWYYSRQLWDNSFCIPLSGLAIAAYADFLASRCSRSLVLSIVSATGALFVHLMALSLVIPMAVHLVIFQRERLAKIKWWLLAIVTLFGLFTWRYLRYLFKDYNPKTEAGLSALFGWFFPLLGGHHLTATGLGSLFGDDWAREFPDPWPAIVFIAQLITCLGYVAVWCGMYLAAGRAWKAIKDPEASPTDHLCAVALGMFLCQVLLDGYQRAYGYDHYFNATWIAYVIFAWLAVEAMWARGWGKKWVRAAVPIYAVALAVALGVSGFKIARDRGGASRSPYGVALDEQIAAVNQIQKFADDSPKDISIAQWEAFPWTLDVLKQVLPATSESRPKRQLTIHYRNAYPGDARIAVEDSPL